MGVSALHHLNIRTTDVATTQKFYEDILGLYVGPRPPFPGAGIWLYSGDHPWVHVSMAKNASGESDGQDDGFGHIAFAVDDLKAMMDKLEERGIEHDLHASPDRQLAQLFFHDPNGVHLEFTCSVAEAEAQGVEVPDRQR
jgi:catechol 2,3-dioxygenase-like lactoylglutathione lyase family enzyme